MKQLNLRELKWSGQGYKGDEWNYQKKLLVSYGFGFLDKLYQVISKKEFHICLEHKINICIYT